MDGHWSRLSIMAELVHLELAFGSILGALVSLVRMSANSVGVVCVTPVYKSDIVFHSTM